MPKKTFFNLPEDKRRNIIRAAEEEFARQGFDLASIQRIVRNAGISRGSFYQYFEDKEDLFSLLLRRMVKKKLDYLRPIMERQGEMDFFSFLKIFVKAGLHYAMENPLSVKIGEDVHNSRTMNWEKLKDIVYKEATMQMGFSPAVFYLELIKKAIKKGEIRPGIKAEAISLHLLSLIEGAAKSLSLGAVEDPYGQGGEEFFDSLVDLLENGLKGD